MTFLSQLMRHLRRGRVTTLILGLVLMMVGLSFFYGGLWMQWDFMNSVYSTIPLLNPTWAFCLPTYAYCWGPAEWSAPFDVAMGMEIFGVFLLLFGGFVAAVTYENV